jgi:hypothetical protein
LVRDTRSDNFRALRTRLLPLGPRSKAILAHLHDLCARGMLDG